MTTNKKILTITLAFVPIFLIAQNNTFSKYGVALSRITTFADNPGFMEKVKINENESMGIEWVADEDSFYYTEDIDGIILFGYKVFHQKENNYIIGVYYDSEGSATYSYIFDVTTNNNQLELNAIITGGDRCHNAVNLDEIKIEDDIISFTSFFTPHKLIN